MTTTEAIVGIVAVALILVRIRTSSSGPTTGSSGSTSS